MVLRDWLEMDDIRYLYPGINPDQCSYLRCVRLIERGRNRGNEAFEQEKRAAAEVEELTHRLWAGDS